MLLPHLIGKVSYNSTSSKAEIKWFGKVDENGITVTSEEETVEVLNYLTGNAVVEELSLGKTFELSFTTREFKKEDRAKYFDEAKFTADGFIDLVSTVGESKRGKATAIVLRPFNAVDDSDDWFFNLGVHNGSFEQVFSGNSVEGYEVGYKFFPIAYQETTTSPVKNSFGRIGPWVDDYELNLGSLVPQAQIIELI